MKLLLVLFLLISSFLTFSQEKTKSLDIEYALSINASFSELQYQKLGAGVGVYAVTNRPMFNLLKVYAGLEYNHQTIETLGRTNSYNLNSFTPLLGLRFVFNRVNIDAGGFLDRYFASKFTGTHPEMTHFPSNQYVTNEVFNPPINKGLFFGVGVKFPTERYTFTIKPEIRFGFTNLENDAPNDVFVRSSRVSLLVQF